MTQFPKLIELSDLKGAAGLRIDGEAQFDHLGYDVASAGDVNGDGFDDILVGATSASRPNALGAGAAYLLFGGRSAFGKPLDLSKLDGKAGFRIDGKKAGDYVGSTVASAGDINGDGFADVVVGTYRASPNGKQSGAAYVVFGKAGGFAKSFSLGALNGKNGFAFNGEQADDSAGWAVGTAGDINGDGFSDLLVSALAGAGTDVNGQRLGTAYVVFGKAKGFAKSMDVSDLTGKNGFTVRGGAHGDYFGDAVSSAGDVNGDGFDDFMVGGSSADVNGLGAGATYVVFGHKGAFPKLLDVSSLNGKNGLRLIGDGLTFSGSAISGGGDINGDGIADLVVNAPIQNVHGRACGTTYVIFGHEGGFARDVYVSAVNGKDGFKINGETRDDESGWDVAVAGDVNGDGFDDILISAYRATPHGNWSGSSYVVFGAKGGIKDARGKSMKTLELSSLDGTNGFKINGEGPGDSSGYSVSTAGDLNRDGFADILVGAPDTDKKGTSSGSTYVMFGRQPDEDVYRTGTNASQTLAGGSGKDRLSGGGGDDRLFGNRGLDKLTGGAGADTFFFNVKPSAASNSDTITDFKPKDDTLAMDKAVFAALKGDLEGHLLAKQFKDLGLKGAKVDKDDRLVYNSRTGDLGYDKDGSGKVKAVLVAHLDNHAHLTAADFLVI